MLCYLLLNCFYQGYTEWLTFLFSEPRTHPIHEKTLWKQKITMWYINHFNACECNDERRFCPGVSDFNRKIRALQQSLLQLDCHRKDILFFQNINYYNFLKTFVSGGKFLNNIERSNEINYVAKESKNEILFKFGIQFRLQNYIL